MDALGTLARVSAILCGLCMIAGSFLVWGRSRAAALLGVLAGTAVVFFELVYFMLAHVSTVERQITPQTMSMLFATASTLQALGTYVPLGIMVFLLARKTAR